MSTMNLPLEIYDTLERKLGREDAMAIAKSIEKSLGHIEQRSYDVAAQRKLEVREELRVEMRDELATKADMASLRGEIQADLAKLQGYVDARFEQVNTRFERLDKKLGRYTTMLSSSTKSHSASYVVPSKGKVVVCMSCLLLKKSGLGHGGQRQFEA